MHRNMYLNKYNQDSCEHQSFFGKIYNTRNPPIETYRPLKSRNKGYDKSTKNGFEKPTKVSYKRTSNREGQDFGKVVNLWEKVAVSESKLEMMGNMMKKGLGFNEIEDFVTKIDRKRTEKEKYGGENRKNQKLVEMTMSMKVVDERKRHSKLLGEKTEAKRKIFDQCGEDREKARKILKKLRKRAKKKKKETREKNNQKIKHLTQKKKVREERQQTWKRKNNLIENIPPELKDIEKTTAFREEEFNKILEENTEACTVGEVELDENEKELLKLHPKFRYFHDFYWL